MPAYSYSGYENGTAPCLAPLSSADRGEAVDLTTRAVFKRSRDAALTEWRQLGAA